MSEKQSIAQTLKQKHEEITETTVYYTLKGYEDKLVDGYPVQDEENKYTFAKATGARKLLKIDDRGNFMNPLGLLSQKTRLDRFVPVSDETFSSYLDFLKTKREMFYLHAQRNAH